jgi:predicted ATPase/DNA-binding winged helix-turn-helix (wHTH) protein
LPDPALRTREQPLAFSSFRLLRDQKILLENQLPVRIGSRALELLIALVERAGEVVGKNELMACVWPDTVVEENNLRVHISAIRKLLGDGEQGARFIINVAGRGYSFVAPVTRDAAQPDALPQHRPSAVLPVALTRVLGRDDVITAVIDLLEKHRLVTILGPGGMGKTTVSLAVADRLASEAGSRVCFADLAAIADPALVVAAIAAAVGCSVSSHDAMSTLLASLQQARLLLIVDNCEHVVGAVAETVENLLRSAPGLRILATSRERLHAEGEHLLSLGPLACPGEERQISASEAMRYPAVMLFVERALNAQDAFVISDGNAATIAAICRRLDGLPLAMELVAARTGTLGLDVLLRSLEQNLTIVSRGRRKPVSRHDSLSATLDWSFRLLSDTEQAILRRISTFSGLFSPQAAAAVVGADVPPETVWSGLMSLVQKSLLVADTSGTSVHYRLLHVNRLFAAARLEDTDEVGAVRCRHAEHYCGVLELASREWDSMSRVQWLATYGTNLPDLRAALQWSFGPEGDAFIGARLFVASLPFGVQLSPEDFEKRASLALDVLQRSAVPDVVAQLRVRTARAVLLLQSGAREEGLRQEIEQMVALALQLGVPKLMTEALSGHAVIALEAADYIAAVQRFEIFQDIAKQADDVYAVLVADRLGAQVFHWAGDQARARARAERVLRHPSLRIPLVYGQGAVDRQVSMRIVLARMAWLEGRADEAREIAAAAVHMAAETPIELCQALGFASCPIALWRGDLEQARMLIDTLLDHSRRYSFARWQRLALCYQQSLDHSPQQDEVTAPVSPLQQDLLTTINARWANAGTLARADSGAAGWCNAELLRVAGEISLRNAGPDSERIADLRYQTALEYARGQGALAWELRIATSRARLHAAEDRRAEMFEALESTCGKFSEGRHTADYRAARELLGS